MKIGLLGGTFDPPHIGHLMVAMAAKHQLALDAVWFMPTADPPHKTVRTPKNERYMMASLAIANEPDTFLTNVEVNAVGFADGVRTYNTLRQLRTEYPKDHFTVIIGGDQATAFGTWMHPEGILKLAEVAVAPRGEPGDYGQWYSRFRHITMPTRIDLSSSMIRAMVARGEPIRHIVPENVIFHIDRHDLYRVDHHDLLDPPGQGFGAELGKHGTIDLTSAKKLG